MDHSNEQGNISLAKIPIGVMFRHVDFESTKNKIYIHYGKVHSGFDYYGESKYIYQWGYVGNLVNGKVVLFKKEDITFSDVSSKAENCYMCKLVGVDVTPCAAST